MDDLKFGTRDKRGYWRPKAKLEPAPLLNLPFNLLAIVKWLPAYLFPWNIIWALSAVAYWHFIVAPDYEAMKVYAWGWALKLFIVNCIAVFLFYGAFELRLYMRRAQGTRFKYNSKFPADHKSPAFFFQSQNFDNILRGFGTGVPIWTAYEVFILHFYANGNAPWVSFNEHPLYLLGVFLLVPLFHELHFFCIHLLIHTPFLYKWVHSVHHNSVNPSPWSSLSMHPVEHALYFAGAFLHVLIPSNPILAIYHLHFAGFGAVVGHVGFDMMEVTDEKAIPSHAYAHYLHHRYFEVNYADGLIPFDKWFGSWHDGTPEGDALMNARYEKRKARMNAKAA
ncbi:MAG: sterol desaturase family protein [Alphaproteobacteria bacterium]|nr:sterol desaturase family protein [Alphaproteobacteria bacterium]